MTEPTIRARGVTKEFAGKKGGAPRRVLAGVDLDVHPGEFVCIVGPSGCGKSTLLNIVAGFIRPTRGEVRIGGKPVQGPSPERIFVFQDNGVFPWLTVRDNIAFGIRQGRRDRLATVAHYLNMVGLQGFEGAYPHELSGGMRQRVEIARALAAKPTTIFMDEPFGALDFLTRLKMRADLTAIWQRERPTILFVTHDIEESAQLADRILVMSQRPATVAAEVPAPLPRPRDLDDVEYLRVRDEVFAQLGMSPRLGSPA